MNNLEQLPLPLFEHLMSYLSPRETLDMRKISHCIDQKVGEIHWNIGKILKLRTIHFEDFEDFQNFVSRVEFSPYSNFRFTFDPFHFLGSNEMEQFLSRFGPTIWRLEIPTVYLFMNPVQIAFFNKIFALEELVVEKIKLWSSGYDIMMSKEIANQNLSCGRGPIASPNYPEPFKRIKKFKFQDCIDGPMALGVLQGLPNLENISLGKLDRLNKENDATDAEYGNSELQVLSRYLNWRNETQPETPQRPVLMYLTLPDDIEDDEDMTDKIVGDFVTAANSFGIRLQNVPVDLVSSVYYCDDLKSDEKRKFFSSIRHMISLYPEYASVDFNAIESLKCYLGTFELSRIVPDRFGIVNQTTWTNLKDISLRMFVTTEEFEIHRDVLQDYWNFLFGIERMSVEEVIITANIVHPDARIILNPLLAIHNMRNLESITLKLPYFQATDYFNLFCELAENIPGIRYLDLEIYGAVDGDMFAGPNTEEPALLKLKELRHLKITHVIKSAQIKDAAASDSTHVDIIKDIFSLLSLTCLTISHMGVFGAFKRTPERAKALTDGKVGETLRVLNWDIADYMSQQEYVDLDMKVDRNRKAVSSIIYPSRRCKNCENYEFDESMATNWFQHSRLF